MDNGTRIKVSDYGQYTGAEGVVVDYQEPFYLVDLDKWVPPGGPIPHWLFFNDEIEAI